MVAGRFAAPHLLVPIVSNVTGKIAHIRYCKIIKLDDVGGDLTKLDKAKLRDTVLSVKEGGQVLNTPQTPHAFTGSGPKWTDEIVVVGSRKPPSADLSIGDLMLRHLAQFPK